MKGIFAELGIELRDRGDRGERLLRRPNIDSFQHLYFDFGLSGTLPHCIQHRWYVRCYVSIDPLT
ncbi:MAG: hypothetical protein R2849_09445 [Thermomicrobiales bacterium]